MSVRRESKRDCYDAIVIGSGIGGLTAAALLAKNGAAVLIVERHDRPGGYAHSFRRHAYRFDSAIHLTSGCESAPGGAAIHQLLQTLGVRDRCSFERVNPVYRAVYPGLELDVRAGVEGFVAAHAERFPYQEKKLRQLIELCCQLRDEPNYIGPSDEGESKKRCSNVKRHADP